MKKKTFDSVQMMRNIRDQLSKKYAAMSIKDEMVYLEKKFSHIRWHSRILKQTGLKR